MILSFNTKKNSCKIINPVRSRIKISATSNRDEFKKEFLNVYKK